MKITREGLKHSGKMVLIIAASIVAGIVLQRMLLSPAHEQVEHQSDISANAQKDVLWTCSMHPHIKLPKPGQCPICSMDLIPVADGGEDDGPRQISLSPYAAKLMEIETVGVERRFVDAEVRMVGKVNYDETRVSYISAWVPGRLDRLFVNYTGIPVMKGDHMVEIYSPDLLTAQEELIQAIGAVEALRQSQSEIVLRTAESTVDAAREKLRLLGLTAEQIRDVEKNKKGSDHITINAPVQGIVIHKNAQEGMYVQTGTRIYTIADLSSVWVKLDAYESDLGWIRYGGQVEFTTESYPGRMFNGVISFIDPIIDSDSHTAKVRLTVANESMALKPGMFVRAVVRTKVASGGGVMNTDLQGKWISPMHPEIIKDAPGSCDVCGMPLVSAESLGYVSEEVYNAPLVIPVSAAMKTGKRAVVYLELPEKDKPTYEGREIVLGPRLGDFYVVESGLNEGDRVVTRGAFKLDAELQIQAKPSMMSEGGSPPPMRHQHGDMSTVSEKPQEKANIPQAFSRQLNAVLNSYFSIQKALAADNPKETGEMAIHANDNLKKVDMGLLTGQAHMLWMDHHKDLKTVLEKLIAQTSLEKQREAFSILSNQMTKTVNAFPLGEYKIYKASCPMAFNNKGASWLQDNGKISNPYFGAMMLRCGEIDELIRQSGE